MQKEHRGEDPRARDAWHLLTAAHQADVLRLRLQVERLPLIVELGLVGILLGVAAHLRLLAAVAVVVRLEVLLGLIPHVLDLVRHADALDFAAGAEAARRNRHALPAHLQTDALVAHELLALVETSRCDDGLRLNLGKAEQLGGVALLERLGLRLGLRLGGRGDRSDRLLRRRRLGLGQRRALVTAQAAVVPKVAELQELGQAVGFHGLTLLARNAPRDRGLAALHVLAALLRGLRGLHRLERGERALALAALAALVLGARQQAALLPAVIFAVTSGPLRDRVVEHEVVALDL
mmetsp:Transcript_2596/g.6668  ORF Transcript_2596/g.6668 Transcript_2596/m.6668 type:complete len:293 (-) Transcript_2596:36-914(-)